MAYVNWKDPDSVQAYEIDWSGDLGTDTIASSVWTVPSTMTQSNAAVSGSVASVTLAGGTIGGPYLVTNEITTAAGFTYDKTLVFRVAQM